MRLVTLINNQHIPRLYQNHLNRLDCGRIGQKSNPQYTTAIKKC